MSNPKEKGKALHLATKYFPSDEGLDLEVRDIVAEFSDSGGLEEYQAAMWEAFKERILLNKKIRKEYGYKRITEAKLEDPDEAYWIPFEIHRKLYEIAFADRDTSEIAPEAWRPPNDEFIYNTNIGKLMKKKGMTYEELHEWSVNNKGDKFWEEIVETIGIKFRKKYKHIQGGTDTNPIWFDGAKMNIIDSCFQANPGKTAIIFTDDGSKYGQSIGNGLRAITYGELEGLVNEIALNIMEMGFGRGDLIAMYSLMTMEYVALYMGIIRAGCTVFSTANSFQAGELRKRVVEFNPDKNVVPDMELPKAIFTQDYYMRGQSKKELYKTVKASGAPQAIVFTHKGFNKRSLRKGDITWDEFIQTRKKNKKAGTELPDDTIKERQVSDPQEYTAVLFSSGTTGTPKGIPWDHTTPVKCAIDGYLHHDIHGHGSKGGPDVVTWTTELGWMMGPWLIYASLINKAIMALCYDFAATPEYGKFVQDAKVTMLGEVPGYVGAWVSGMMDPYDWSNIKCFSNTGEPSNIDDMFYLMHLAGYRPIIEYCGGTEIGGGFITGTLVQPASPGIASTPALGSKFYILHKETHKEVIRGDIHIRPPILGLSRELVNIVEKEGEVFDHDMCYYRNAPPSPAEGETLRKHGDEIRTLKSGGYRIAGRGDVTISKGGVKASPEEIQSRVILHPAVHDVAAIGARREGEWRSEKIFVFTQLNNDRTLTIYRNSPEKQQELLKEMAALVKEKYNPLLAPDVIVLVEKVKRTPSGKITHKLLKLLAQDKTKFDTEARENGWVVIKKERRK